MDEWTNGGIEEKGHFEKIKEGSWKKDCRGTYENFFPIDFH